MGDPRLSAACGAPSLHPDSSLRNFHLHAGCPLRVDFTEPLTEEQRGWLLRTPLTLRRISFCPEDVASSTLLHR